MTEKKWFNEEEFEYDGDILTYLGSPFTGEARLPFPDGSTKQIKTYRDGFEEGLVREWYGNGQVKREWTASRGLIDGVSREWHPNGELKCLGNYERGIELVFQEWDQEGNSVAFRALKSGSKLHELLLLRRQEKKSASPPTA